MGYFSDTMHGEDGHWISGTMADTTTGGGVFNWQNIEDDSIVIDRVIIDVTTAATSTTATVDIGTTTSSATTVADTLLDGVDVSTTNTGLSDNLEEDQKGTDGKSSQKLAKGKWVTASQKTGDIDGLVGKWYLHYRKIRP